MDVGRMRRHLARPHRRQEADEHRRKSSCVRFSQRRTLTSGSRSPKAGDFGGDVQSCFPSATTTTDAGIAFVTISMIALNGLAFLLEINQPTDAHVQAFITAWGVVPREYSAGVDLPPEDPVSALDHAADVDVPARRLGTPRWEHAVPLDLRRQHRAPRSDTCASSSSTWSAAWPPASRTSSSTAHPRSRRWARRARSAASSAGICCCFRTTAST